MSRCLRGEEWYEAPIGAAEDAQCFKSRFSLHSATQQLVALPAHYAKAELAERGAIARFKDEKTIITIDTAD